MKRKTMTEAVVVSGPIDSSGEIGSHRIRVLQSGVWRRDSNSAQVDWRIAVAVPSG